MRSRLRLAATLLAVLGVPVPGEATPRISLLSIRGDANGSVRKQLGAVLCVDYECVPPSRIRTAGKIDFAKVEAQKVAGIVAGTVATARKGGQRLELALLTRSLSPVWGRIYPLTGEGILSRDSAMDLAQELATRLAARAPLEPPPPAPSAPRPARPAPPRAPEVAPPVAAAPPPFLPSPETRPEPRPVAPPRPADQRTTKAAAIARGGVGAPAREPATERLLAAIEAGVHLTQRTLGYQGVPSGASALRGYEANVVASPRFRLEVYPASLLTENVFAGMGLFANYGFSVGMKTNDPAGGAERPTSLVRLAAGLLWRFHPVPSSRFALVPAVSYQQSKFTIEPLAGVPIKGLPDADLSGVKAGVAAEIPASDAVFILLGAGYVKWTTARDLVGDGFFPAGKAYAIEAEAGLSLPLSGLLSLRIVGEYSDTRYSLQPDPTGTYQASGAADRYLGGSVMLRARF